MFSTSAAPRAAGASLQAANEFQEDVLDRVRRLRQWQMIRQAQCQRGFDHRLDNATAKVFSRAVTLTETRVVPALERAHDLAMRA